MSIESVDLLIAIIDLQYRRQERTFIHQSFEPSPSGRGLGAAASAIEDNR